MTEPAPIRDNRSFAARFGMKGLSIVAAIAVVVAILQRTPLGPFPHRSDDFLAGFAVGITLVLIGSLIWRPKG